MKLNKQKFKRAMKKAGHTQAGASVHIGIGTNAIANICCHGIIPKRPLDQQALLNYINEFI